MPEDDDFAGAVVSPVAAFLCFLWVDFIEPFSSDFIEESPDFIESLPVCIGVAAVEAGVGSFFIEESCAKAAPLITVQPASIARISFVLRMTTISWNLWRL
jgi:hypothetical protein